MAILGFTSPPAGLDRSRDQSIRNSSRPDCGPAPNRTAHHNANEHDRILLSWAPIIAPQAKRPDFKRDARNPTILFERTGFGKRRGDL
jgi:hypothetical protein